MTVPWQDIAAIGLVFAAAVYLVHRLWQSAARKRAGACDCCSGCLARRPEPLISIDPGLSGERREATADTER
jgi:hypothetical protein